MTPQIRYGMGGEGAHWYALVDGEPRCAYEIERADGKGFRSVDLRDAKKYGFFPGITKICSIPSSPGLEKWKRRQMMYAALTNPKVPHITDHEELFRVLEKDAADEAKQAAQKGKLIHSAIERWFRNAEALEEYEPYIKGVRDLLGQLVGKDDRGLWKTEETVVHPLGYGTRIDLYSKMFNCIVDFKGKEFGPDDQVKGWPEQARQLVAGREALMPYGQVQNDGNGHTINPARCINVFFSRNNPGLVKAYEWDEADLVKAWKEFKLLLEFWQVSNGVK